VSISYTTQTVGSVRSVTFSQTVTNAHAFSHSVQCYCAVSCVKLCKCTDGTQTDCGHTVTVWTSLNTQPSKIKHLDKDWNCIWIGRWLVILNWKWSKYRFVHFVLTWINWLCKMILLHFMQGAHGVDRGSDVRKITFR
jgi:hypothetical protein